MNKRLTAEELRLSIIEKAVTGKLVKHNPIEGTGNDVVLSIRSIRKVKTSEIDCDEVDYDLPENWALIRLKEVAEIYTGNSINEEEKDKKYRNCIGYDYIGTKDVNFDKTIAYNNGVNIPETENFKLCPANKILMCIEGGSAGRKIALTDRVVCFGNKLACFNTVVINDEYLFYFLQSGQFKKVFKDNLNGIIGGVSVNTLKNLPIAIPPLEEQKRIVEKIKEFEILLEKYDDVVSQLNELDDYFSSSIFGSFLNYLISKKHLKNFESSDDLVAEIRTKKQKILSGKKDKYHCEIVFNQATNSYCLNTIGKTRINDYSDYLFELPAGWNWMTLNELSIQITDGTHKTPKYVENGVPFLSVQNISTGAFDFSKLKYISKEEHEDLIKRCHPELNDILICRIGTLGKPIINTLDLDYSIFVSLGLIKLVDKTMSEYIYIVLKSPFIERYINRVKVGGGTHTYKINIEDLCTFPIPIPPKSDQDYIVKKYKQLLKAFENIEI